MIEVCRDNRVIRVADRHAIYCDDMENYFESFFSTVMPREEDGRFIADFSTRRLHTLADGRQFEFTSIPEESVDYMRHWNGGGIAFDLGAYCGFTSIEIARRSEKVLALEPDPENFACLMANLERHRISNVVALPLAAAGQCGIELFSTEGTIGSAFPRCNGRESVSGYLEVQTATLSKLVEICGVPSFIKADIEGAEIEVLREAMPILREHRPVIALDTNHWNGNSLGTYDQCESIMRECGYKVESEQIGGMWTTWGW